MLLRIILISLNCIGAVLGYLLMMQGIAMSQAIAQGIEAKGAGLVFMAILGLGIIVVGIPVLVILIGLIFRISRKKYSNLKKELVHIGLCILAPSLMLVIPAVGSVVADYQKSFDVQEVTAVESVPLLFLVVGQEVTPSYATRLTDHDNNERIVSFINQRLSGWFDPIGSDLKPIVYVEYPGSQEKHFLFGVNKDCFLIKRGKRGQLLKKHAKETEQEEFMRLVGIPSEVIRKKKELRLFLETAKKRP